MIAATSPLVVAGLFALLTAIVTALGALLVAIRRFSGKVARTAAGDLWEASDKFQTNLAAQLASALLRLAKVEGRLADVEGLNTGLTRANINLERQFNDCHAQLEALTARHNAEDGK